MNVTRNQEIPPFCAEQFGMSSHFPKTWSQSKLLCHFPKTWSQPKLLCLNSRNFHFKLTISRWGLPQAHPRVGPQLRFFAEATRRSTSASLSGWASGMTLARGPAPVPAPLHVLAGLTRMVWVPWGTQGTHVVLHDGGKSAVAGCLRLRRSSRCT